MRLSGVNRYIYLANFPNRSILGLCFLTLFVLKFRRPDSPGSDVTNLSLLSTSDLDPLLHLRGRIKKKKKVKPIEKTDWEKYANERHGALAQLLQVKYSTRILEPSRDRNVLSFLISIQS